MSEWRHSYVAMCLDSTSILVKFGFIGTHDHFTVANHFALFAHRKTNGRSDFNISLQHDDGWITDAPLYATCGQDDGTMRSQRDHGQVH